MTQVRCLLLTIALAAFAGCSGSGQVTRILDADPGRFPATVLLDAVPFYPQQAYQCGPAALATTLTYSGVATSPELLVDKVYIPARRGSLQAEMLAATRSAGRIPYLLEPALPALLEEVNAGRPVLVFQNLGLSWLPQWHYAVVVGFDLEAGTLTLRSGTVRDYRISLTLFEKTWQRTGNWGFVALIPGELPADPDPQRLLAALVDMEQVATSDALIPGYLAAVERWPESPVFSAALGNLYYRLGDLHEAQLQFESLTHSHPHYADAHNNLAHLLLEQGRPELALPHARTAVALGGPRSATYQSTLAAALAALPTQP